LIRSSWQCARIEATGRDCGIESNTPYLALPQQLAGLDADGL